MKNYVLQAEDVAIHYGGVKAVDGVALTLEKGQIRFHGPTAELLDRPVEVRYRIDPGGQLEASNQLVLNQLVFGERIAGNSQFAVRSLKSLPLTFPTTTGAPKPMQGGVLTKP